MSWLREYSIDWFLVCCGIGALVGMTAGRYTPRVAFLSFAIVVALGVVLELLGYDI